jgi:hypothetical protein
MYVIVAFFLLYLVRGMACDLETTKGFISHDLKIAVGNKDQFGKITGIGEEDFLATIKNFENKFARNLEDNHDYELIVFKSWKSSTVNAYAERDKDKIMITVYGGIARHKAVTKDGFALVLCHELGHHLGGYPKKSTNRWSSAEGQADYYATMTCLKKLWEDEDNRAVVQTLNVPEFAKNKCADAYKAESEQILCQRVSMAGKSIALMFQDLDQESFEPEFHTPDPQVSSNMVYLHPFSQCRLDTYFQGSLCSKNEFILDEDDEHFGTCTLRNGDILGIRPACWFKTRN